MKVSKTKAIAYAAILLAVCICSQFFKNLSVYITGPIINACLIVCVMTAGLGYAIALSIITPITSFLITGSPIMSAIPLIIPCVMLGNIVLVVCVALLNEKPNKKIGFPLSMAVGAILKGLFMGLVIAAWVVPSFIPEKMAAMQKTIQITFSTTQLITAAIGGVVAFLVLLPVKKSIKD